MAEIKLTKNELRNQQNKLSQLEKYLPTLQLKKALLQLEVNEARGEITQFEENYKKLHSQVRSWSEIITSNKAINFEEAVKVQNVAKRYENIAGVEVPYFESITFEPYDYRLFDTPAWVDSAISYMRKLAEAQAKIKIAEEKKRP